jgi:hypothetical protein
MFEESKEAEKLKPLEAPVPKRLDVGVELVPGKLCDWLPNPNPFVDTAGAAAEELGTMFGSMVANGPF